MWRCCASRGVGVIEPDAGDMACGEEGVGRLADLDEIESRVMAELKRSRRLSGFDALVTSGPTRERLDSVRYVSNGSSGLQGYEIAHALAGASARTRLVSGPVSLSPPAGVETTSVTTAQEMLDACMTPPVPRVAVCAAAVSDWRPRDFVEGKMEKTAGLSLEMEQTPDILARLSEGGAGRPDLVVGFAAEDGIGAAGVRRAREKLTAKGCDWILLNDISAAGSDENEVVLVSGDGEEVWGRGSKRDVAARLVDRVGGHFGV